MLIIAAIVSSLLVSGFVVLNLPAFGALPKGERLKRIKASPNYKEGKFQNLTETPMQSEDANMAEIIFKFLKGDKNSLPTKPIPTIKSDLKIIHKNKTVLTWFGHSSYLLQINNFNILVDPVFSERTSPVKWVGTKAFSGTDIYDVNDLPKIDVVLLTHDHYDHLDFETIKKLGNNPAKYLTTLGVGAHLEKWGIDKDKITETDWWDETVISNHIRLITTPARHFSGRHVTGRNQSLWSSFVLLSPGQKIYLGGDSGYEDHFKDIGNKFGPFDLTILECGQYNKYWPYIHMMPEETAQAAIDLKAKMILPVHWAKFKLSTHHWSESVKRVLAKANELNMPVTTPQIGEQIILQEYYPQKNWWEGI